MRDDPVQEENAPRFRRVMAAGTLGLAMAEKAVAILDRHLDREHLIVVLAGLSTNPSGQAVSSSQVDQAADSVRSEVSGFWLNDPAAGADCPKCNGPYPHRQISTLRRCGCFQSKQVGADGTYAQRHVCQ